VCCASTPYGACSVFAGEAYCFDPPLAAVHHLPHDGLCPECKAMGSEVECDFRCLISKGKIACAQTPYGNAGSTLARLKCWDPPKSAIHEYGAELARLTGITASTSFAYGYDCKSSRSAVKCARTPRGQCVKEDLQLGCFDPPAPVQCTHTQFPGPEEVRLPKTRRRVESRPEATPGER